MQSRTLATIGLIAVIAGCGVPERQHHAVLRDMDRCRTELAASRKAHAGLEAKHHGLEAENERLKAELAAAREGMRVPASHPVPEIQPALDVAELAKGVRMVAEGKYEVQRDTLNKVLENIGFLARAARIVPSFKDGRYVGFKLYAIRPGSLFTLIGLANGDVISSINGISLTSPAEGMRIYSEVREAGKLTFALTRRGLPVTLVLTIR